MGLSLLDVWADLAAPALRRYVGARHRSRRDTAFRTYATAPMEEPTLSEAELLAAEVRESAARTRAYGTAVLRYKSGGLSRFLLRARIRLISTAKRRRTRDLKVAITVGRVTATDDPSNLESRRCSAAWGAVRRRPCFSAGVGATGTSHGGSSSGEGGTSSAGPVRLLLGERDRQARCRSRATRAQLRRRRVSAVDSRP